MIASPSFLNKKDAWSSKHRTEALMGIITERYISGSELVIGDNEKARLPDLYSEDHSVGYEVVQCELECDNLKHKIYKTILIYDGNSDETCEYLSKKKFPVGKYDFYTDKDKKICSFRHNEYFRKVRYLDSVYKKNISGKLSKLNKGKYDSCRQKNLISCSILRLRGKIEAENVAKIYEAEHRKHHLSFDNVYFVTIKGVYIVYPKLKTIVEFDDFSKYVIEMKAFLCIEE